MTIDLERTQTLYKLWLTDSYIDEATKTELKQIKDNQKEIEDRFFKDLEFGTGGMRGLMGAGTNRMNRFTVRRASQGLSSFILENKPLSPSVVIAYDSRRMSAEYALEVALVCAANEIKVYLFNELKPTPLLSFAIRYLHATAGIMITASHNPPEYNGLKIYGADGAQYLSHDADKVIEKVNAIQNFSMIKSISKDSALKNNHLVMLNDEIDELYLHEVVKCSQIEAYFQQTVEQIKVVYTPLHGTGYKLVKEILNHQGFKHLFIVNEQASPDSEFATVKSPNPEEKEAFNLAIDLAIRQKADIIIGTDPDCDRMGAVIRSNENNYMTLNGNQIGAILVYYLLNRLEEKGKLPHNGAIVKTIVTNELGTLIATQFGIRTFNTLTGFKYIAEKMNYFNQNGIDFIFGYEESYGFLSGNYARDKDGVLASLLIAESAAYFMQKGKSLLTILTELYERYGYFIDFQYSKTLKGKEGIEKIHLIMESWRNHVIKDIDGLEIDSIEDFSKGIHGLPKENVLKYNLTNGSWFCLRPSGTEPKLKYYFSIKDQTSQDAQIQLERVSRYVLSKDQ